MGEPGQGSRDSPRARVKLAAIRCDFKARPRAAPFFLTQGSRPSTIKRVFLDPVEPAIDEQKLITIREMQLHVHLVVVHLAI